MGGVDFCKTASRKVMQLEQRYTRGVHVILYNVFLFRGEVVTIALCMKKIS